MRKTIDIIILALILVFAMVLLIYGKYLAHHSPRASMGMPPPAPYSVPSPFVQKHKPSPNNYDDYFAVDSIPQVPILKQTFHPGYYYWIRRGQKLSDAKYCATWDDFNKLSVEVTGMPYPTEIVRKGGTAPGMLMRESFAPGKYFFPGFGQKPSDARYCATLDDYTKMFNELDRTYIPGGVVGKVLSIIPFSIVLVPLLFSFGIASLLTIMGEMAFARGHKLFGPSGYYESLMGHRRRWFAYFAGASIIIPIVLVLVVIKASLLSLVGLVASILALYFVLRISSTRTWRKLSRQQCPKCRQWNRYTYYGTKTSWIFLRHSTPSPPCPHRPYFYDEHCYWKGSLWKTVYYYFCCCGHDFHRER